MLDIHEMFDVRTRPNDQPCPEDVFLAWALSLPMDADIAAAARQEITRLDNAKGLTGPVRRLRKLLQEATTFDGGTMHRNVGNC